MNTTKIIFSNIIRDTFDVPLMGNSMRGFFAEYMIAEALGDCCKVVGKDWHAWDLQVGNDHDDFPDRIRIQVKNTARLQSWHPMTGKASKCQWTLPIKPRPAYFEEYYPGVSCEDYGHLCDLYILCHHPIDDHNIADHRDVNQWEFYLVPIVGDKAMYPATPKPENQKSNVSYTVVPESLRKGIRGRPPVEPISFGELKLDTIKATLGLRSTGANVPIKTMQA